jgi:hypothetical protein
MKGIDSTGAPLVHVPGLMDGWMEVKAVLRIAYSNQKLITIRKINLNEKCRWQYCHTIFWAEIQQGSNSQFYLLNWKIFN